MNVQDLVRRGIDAVRRADADSYTQLFAENAIVHHPLAPEPLEGRAAIREAEQALFDAFSEIEIEVLRLLSDDRGAAVEVVLRATHTGAIDLGGGQPVPPTGRRIEVPSAWFFEVGPDGLVITERDYFDTATFMSQLGLDVQ